MHGGELEQIQVLLGHAWVQATERYLGCKQNFGYPVNYLFCLGVRTVACSITGSIIVNQLDRIVCEHGGRRPARSSLPAA